MIGYRAETLDLRDHDCLVRIDQAMPRCQVWPNRGWMSSSGASRHTVGIPGRYVARRCHHDVPNLRRCQAGTGLLDEGGDSGELGAAADVPLNAAQPSLLVVSSPFGCVPPALPTSIWSPGSSGSMM